MKWQMDDSDHGHSHVCPLFSPQRDREDQEKTRLFFPLCLTPTWKYRLEKEKMGNLSSFERIVLGTALSSDPCHIYHGGAGGEIWDHHPEWRLDFCSGRRLRPWVDVLPTFHFWDGATKLSYLLTALPTYHLQPALTTKLAETPSFSYLPSFYSSLCANGQLGWGSQGNKNTCINVCICSP